jgi:Methyltransferase domain
MHRRIHIERLRSKADIVNWLGWQAGYRSYLEIATPFTGFQFSLIAPDVFAEINRVVYFAPPDFDDGQPVTCLGSSTDSSACLRRFVDQRKTFDLIFVDPWHTYESSLRDIQLALTLLTPEGKLVVHDCHPTTPELATPETKYPPGAWMGETYLAFLDVARVRPELAHSVVDLDCGCGLLWRRQATGQGLPEDEVELSRAAPLGVRLSRLGDVRGPRSGDYEPGAAGGVSAAPSAPAPIFRLAPVPARGACGRGESHLRRCVDGGTCLAQAAARHLPPTAPARVH